jgi:hypothetical protein
MTGGCGSRFGTHVVDTVQHFGVSAAMREQPLHGARRAGWRLPWIAQVGWASDDPGSEPNNTLLTRKPSKHSPCRTALSGSLWAEPQAPTAGRERSAKRLHPLDPVINAR